MKVPNTVKAYNYEEPKFNTRHLHDNEKAENEIFIITSYFTKFSMLLLYI